MVKEINAAKTDDPRPGLFSFTSAPIAKALVDAHKRGVEVQVILDKSQRTEKYSSADFVQHAGIPIWIDAKHAIAHNKIMVIDGADGHHRQLQLHEERRGEQRREPAGDPLPGTGDEVHGQLEGPSSSIRRSTRGRRRGIRKRTRSATQAMPAPRLADACDGYVASKNSAGVPQGGLQVGGEDFGEEPRPLQHQGRGDSGGEEAVCTSVIHDQRNPQQTL